MPTTKQPSILSEADAESLSRIIRIAAQNSSDELDFKLGQRLNHAIQAITKEALVAFDRNTERLEELVTSRVEVEVQRLITTEVRLQLRKAVEQHIANDINISIRLKDDTHA